MGMADADIRDEIKSGKIQFLLTQSIDRKEYFRGKILFYFTFSFFWLLFLLLFSWVIARVPFSGRLPYLISGKTVSEGVVFLNLIVNFLLLGPVVLFLITLSISTGFYFRMSVFSIIIFIIVVLTGVTSAGDYLYPFLKMRIYNGKTLQINMMSAESLYFLVITFISDLILLFISNKTLNNREM